MGEALRQEVAETDIKVTLIEPGMVDTPFFETAPPAPSSPTTSPVPCCSRSPSHRTWT